MTTGAELKTFINNLNGGAAIDDTLLSVLVDNAKAIFEAERPWMALRKVDTSKTVATSNTWQSAIDLSTIADFARFYSEAPIQLFDGDQRISYYALVQLQERLQNKNVSYTAVHDVNAQRLYLNGTVPYAGTLWLPYIANSTAIDLASEAAVWTNFPSRFLAILGYYAIGIFKGAVDYDEINRAMLPANAAALGSLKNAAEKWDNELQLSAIENTDPTGSSYPRSGAIDRYANS